LKPLTLRWRVMTWASKVCLPKTEVLEQPHLFPLNNFTIFGINLSFCQVVALPHQKCYRKWSMPQIENVTQMA
jgi:hypothetical protein